MPNTLAFIPKVFRKVPWDSVSPKAEKKNKPATYCGMFSQVITKRRVV